MKRKEEKNDVERNENSYRQSHTFYSWATTTIITTDTTSIYFIKQKMFVFQNTYCIQ